MTATRPVTGPSPATALQREMYVACQPADSTLPTGVVADGLLQVRRLLWPTSTAEDWMAEECRRCSRRRWGTVEEKRKA